MQINLNGQPHTFAQQQTVAELLQELGLAEKRIVVELNLEIVPRSMHAQTYLQPGDSLEIVHAIGGG